MNSVRVLGCAFFALLLAACQQQAEIEWAEVLAAEHRSESHRQRDVFRHPDETLAYFEIEPCQTVVEIWPGGAGWYTEVLAPVLARCGKLYAAHFDPNSELGFLSKSRAAFEEKIAAAAEVYRAVETTVLAPPEQLAIAPDGSADRVLTFRNVHNWLKAGTADAVFSAFYKALKPGGLLGVVEHRARPDTALELMIDTGYVTEAKVIELANAAGFEFVGGSEINANLLDDTDHPKGVWSLPPTLRGGETGLSEYLAIGESDRMTLKFRKPANE